MRRLLVFAKEPIPGKVKTRLAAAVGDDVACALYRAFLADTADTVACLDGVRVAWWVDGDPRSLAAVLRSGWSARRQAAADLGHRLAEAFEASFQDGDGPAAAIGTDCPLLRREHLEELFARLEAGADAALIPAEDGGYAALGLRRPCPAVFERIPWSTPRVLEATTRVLTALNRSFAVLAPRYDVDDLPSLERLGRDLAGSPGLAPQTAAALARFRLTKSWGRSPTPEP